METYSFRKKSWTLVHCHFYCSDRIQNGGGRHFRADQAVASLSTAEAKLP